MEEIILQEKILEIQAKVFLAQLPYLEKLHGLNCDIYLPQAYNGNYDNDGKRVYLEQPNETNKRFVVFNYFQLGQYGNPVFEPFGENPRSIITDFSKKLEQNSKIVVKHGFTYYEYRVDNFKAFRGKDGYILIQNILIPLV